MKKEIKLKQMEILQKYIKEKNKQLKNNFNKNINDYFLILKINIPLFNDPE